MEIDEEKAKQGIKALGGVDTLYFFAEVLDRKSTRLNSSHW